MLGTKKQAVAADYLPCDHGSSRCTRGTTFFTFAGTQAQRAERGSVFCNEN
jgi:hypothetical protein